jgi:hypothetical protein
MLTLATHQSSIWGYNALIHILPNLGNFSASYNYTGSFTKPTLAPNGKMYSIMTCRSCDINTVTKTSVILEITPGNSNTATTNYSIPTVNYIVADPGFLQNQSGFAKSNFPDMAPPNSGNNGVRFNTGILAPNGLIYFPPIDNQTGINKWVVFNPTNGLWKLMNLHPGFAETDPGLPNSAVTTAVLGTDGKIYAFGYGTGTVPYYRFTPTTNASGDVASLQTGYYQNLGLNSTPLCNSTNLGWKDSAGTSYTDTAPSTGTPKAYANTGPSGQPYNKVKTFIDIIVHPSGRIYLIPGTANQTSGNVGDTGRGRIFYLNISAWGSATELVSATGLVAPGGKRISAHYAFLEKPRDENHANSPLNATLKIYIVPAPRLGTTTTVCTEVLCIDPTTNTITEIPFTFTTDTNSTGIGKRISLSNGLNIFYNAGSGAGNFVTTNRSGGHLLTGWDVPESDTDGAITIDTITRGILHNDLPATFSAYDPGYSLIGGGVNATYPHHSKFIGNPSATNTISELVSVKQYGPGITNFNFEDRDKNTIAPPSNLVGLQSSIFNSNFNKPK